MASLHKTFRQRLSWWKKKVKELYQAHRHMTLPGSRYTLYNIIHADRGYRGMEKALAPMTIAIIKKYYQPGESVLDVGGGSGYHVPYFIDAGMEYYGVDLSETATAVAMMKYPRLQFFNCSAYEFKSFFPEKRFDNTYLCAVLEHLGNWRLVLENLLYVTKKKVVLVFYEGLSPLEKNYYEFHPFTDQRLLNFEILPQYGYKPVIEPQRCTEIAYVFEQAGSDRISLDVATEIVGLSKEQLQQNPYFAYDRLSNTLSFNKTFLYAQNHNPNIEQFIHKLPVFVEKRRVLESEVGYFLNRYSRKELEQYLTEKQLKYEIIDCQKNNDNRDTATAVIISL